MPKGAKFPAFRDPLDLAGGDLEFLVERMGDAVLEGFEDRMLVVAAHRDDEGEAEGFHVAVVEFGEPRVLLRRQPVEAGSGLLGLRGGGQLVGECQPARKIRVGAQHLGACLAAGGAELGAHGLVHAL